MVLPGAVYSVLLLLHLVQGDEPHCSKFDFEEKVLEKLVKMEFQMERLKLEMQGTKETVGNMKNTMEKTVDVVNKKEETLNSKMTQLDIFKDTLEETLNSTRTQLESFKVKLGEDIKSNLATEIANFKEVQRKPKPSVAFKARSNAGINVKNGQTIVFPVVILNEGSGYDSTTGVFTAPVNGTYLLTTAFCVTNTHPFNFSIKLNDKQQSVTMLYGDAAHSCHSADAIGLLTAGQKAWVQVGPGGSNGIIIDHHDSYRWNTFSGLLVND